MNHRWAALLAGLAILLIGAACAPAASPPPPTAAPPTKAAAPTTAAPTTAPAPTQAQPAAQPTKPAAPTTSAIDSLASAAKAEGKLVVYTSTTSEVLEAIADGYTKKYGIQVDYSKKSAGEVAQLVDTEQRTGKMRGDILGVGDEIQPVIWAKNGVLAKYQPEGLKDVPPELRDPEGFWVAPYMNLIGIMYSTARLKEGERPRTYQELADPRWKGRLSMGRSRTCAVCSTATNVLVNSYGWQYFEAVAKSAPLMADSVSALPPMLINGETDVIFSASDSLGNSVAARGEPVAFIFPADVVPAGGPVSVPFRFGGSTP